MSVVPQSINDGLGGVLMNTIRFVWDLTYSSIWCYPFTSVLGYPSPFCGLRLPEMSHIHSVIGTPVLLLSPPTQRQIIATLEDNEGDFDARKRPLVEELEAGNNSEALRHRSLISDGVV